MHGELPRDRGRHAHGAGRVIDQEGDAAEYAATVQVVWPFAGFFGPADNPPLVNVMNAGRAVPLKFSLGGDRGPAVLAAGSPTSPAVAGASGADAVEETVTAGGSALSYGAASGRYTYTWKTEKAWAGTCRQLTLALADGTQHTALFRFTR